MLITALWLRHGHDGHGNDAHIRSYVPRLRSTLDNFRVRCMMDDDAAMGAENLPNGRTWVQFCSLWRDAGVGYRGVVDFTVNYADAA